MRVAVLVSGGGTNLQALLDAKAAGGLPGVEFVYVLSSRSKAYALERARAAGIPTGVLRRRDFSSQESFDAAMVSVLAPYKPDYVVLAGYLCKLGQTFLQEWPDRVLNIHPALLPDFGGEGMYGIRPHEAVLARGDLWTGATVHVVNSEYDKGRIILQKKVQVLPDDTPERLQQRVMEEAEWQIYPEVLRLLAAEFESDQLKKEK